MAESRNRKHIQIKLEEPPRRKRGRPEGSGPVQKYLRRLEATYPNEWAIYDRKAKSIGHLKRLQSTEFPNLEYVQRSNGDNTLSVWVRMVPASVLASAPTEPETKPDGPTTHTVEVTEDALDELRRHFNGKDKDSIAKAFDALMRGDS